MRSLMRGAASGAALFTLLSLSAAAVGTAEYAGDAQRAAPLPAAAATATAPAPISLTVQSLAWGNVPAARTTEDAQTRKLIAVIRTALGESPDRLARACASGRHIHSATLRGPRQTVSMDDIAVTGCSSNGELHRYQLTGRVTAIQ